MDDYRTNHQLISLSTGLSKIDSRSFLRSYRANIFSRMSPVLGLKMTFKTIERIVLFLAAIIVLGETLVQSGILTYAPNLPNSPAVAFVLILIVDIIYDAKRERFL